MILVNFYNMEIKFRGRSFIPRNIQKIYIFENLTSVILWAAEELLALVARQLVALLASSYDPYQHLKYQD